MICRTCKKENEFYQGQSICKECNKKRYRDKYKQREKKEYPQAICINCEKLFVLNFLPKNNPSKIPNKWICKECFIVV